MADPGDTVTVSGTPAETDHGKIVAEYVNVPHDGSTYALTDRGVVLRMFYGSPFRLYYTIDPGAVAEFVASLRASGTQKVTVDRWKGPVPEIETPTLAAGGEEVVVATTAKEKPKAKAKTEKPKSDGKAGAKRQRLGARAKRLLEGGLGLSAARQKEVLAAADAIAQGRGDAMTRIWDIYEAAGEKMPEGIAAEKIEFDRTGKMPRNGSQTRSVAKPRKAGRGNGGKAGGDKPDRSPPKTQQGSAGSTLTASGGRSQDGGGNPPAEGADETL